jgi:hypothetical protein
VAQLHTHPGAAFHSGTDDEFPIVRTPGFLSIVLPEFGKYGLRELAACAAYEVGQAGIWLELNRDELESLVEWTNASTE